MEKAFIASIVILSLGLSGCGGGSSSSDSSSNPQTNPTSLVQPKVGLKLEGNVLVGTYEYSNSDFKRLSGSYPTFEADGSSIMYVEGGLLQKGTYRLDLTQLSLAERAEKIQGKTIRFCLDPVLNIDDASVDSIFSKTDEVCAVLKQNTGTAPKALNIHMEGTVDTASVLKAVYDYTDAENDLQAEATYRWFVNGSEVSKGSTYQPEEKDIGKSLKLCVTPKSTLGVPSVGTQVCVNGTQVIAQGSNVKTPFITDLYLQGKPVVGETLKVNASCENCDLGKSDIQWWVDRNNNKTFENDEKLKATGYEYQLAAEDVGHPFKLSVLAKNSVGNLIAKGTYDAEFKYRAIVQMKQFQDESVIFDMGIGNLPVHVQASYKSINPDVSLLTQALSKDVEIIPASEGVVLHQKGKAPVYWSSEHSQTTAINALFKKDDRLVTSVGHRKLIIRGDGSVNEFLHIGDSILSRSSSNPDVDLAKAIKYKRFRIAKTGSLHPIQLTFVLREDGKLIGWTDESKIGTTSMPKKFEIASDVLSFSVVNSRIVFLTKAGKVGQYTPSTLKGQSLNDRFISFESVESQLKSSVQKLIAIGSVGMAIKKNGTLITWGNKNNGADVSSLISSDDPVSDVVTASNGLGEAFAILKQDGGVVTVGDKYAGGDSSKVRERLVNIEMLISHSEGFVAISKSGELITWGYNWGLDNAFGDAADKLKPAMVRIKK